MWNHLKARQAQATDSARTRQYGTKKRFSSPLKNNNGFGTLGCVRIDTELKDGDEIDAK